MLGDELVDVVSNSHDIPEVFIRLIEARIQDDAEELDAHRVLLLELRPNRLDHGVDAFLPVVRGNKSVIFSTDVFVVEDPSMVQELHDIDPSGFITLESGVSCAPVTVRLLPYFPPMW